MGLETDDKAVELIGAAFGVESDYPLPAIAEEILGHEPTVPDFKAMNTLSDEELVEALRRPWDLLDQVPPPEYRRRLAGNMLAALDPRADHAHITRPLRHLTPSFWRLYHKGRDPHFTLRVSHLNKAQSLAVVVFLGRMLSREARTHRLWAAQALRHGWGQVNHPAVGEAQELFESLTNFTYPVPVEPEIAALVGQIRAAFDGTPYPGDDQLCGSKQGDEPAEIAIEFAGRDWRKLHPDFLEHFSEAHSFLTHAGYRYYLPAFMIARLMVPQLAKELGRDYFEADGLHSLTHGFSTPLPLPREVAEMMAELPKTDWRAYGEERFGAYTPAERRAVADYLRFCAQDDPFEAAQIQEALDTYWAPEKAV